MAYTQITNGEIDSNSPLDVNLLTKIRDNGDEHNHSEATTKRITQASFAYVAGNVLIISADIVLTSYNYTSYTKVKDIQICKPGTLRINFDMQRNSGGGWAYGRIYRNGIAVGTEQQTASGLYVTFSEDIPGWSVGDYVQLYVKISSAVGSIRNFRLYSNEVDFNTVILD